tara:strand:- start:175 stop:342 length:168 start_codon:yes stop_codon:yes gene_type:complete
MIEETYTVSWAIAPDLDYWERCESLEEAQELYNKVMQEPALYTASIGKEIQSTES